MATTTSTYEKSLIENSSDHRTRNTSIVRLDNKGRVRRPWNLNLSNFPAAGILLAIFSSFSFSIAYFLVKIVESADPVLFVIYRGYFQLFAFLAVAVYKDLSLKDILDRKTVLCLCLTGLFGAVQQITSFYAIKYIPIADGTAVLLSAPVFVSIFACVLLKEKCGVFQIVTVLLALVGVLLVCRPSFIFGTDSASSSQEFSNRIFGFGLIFAGCILMAAMYISLRKAAHVPFPITNATMAIFSIIVALSFSLISGKDFQQPRCGWDSTFVVSSAVLGTFGMLLFVLATQIEHAGPVSVARTSEIVFAFVWQMSVLGQIPSWTSLLGATIVVSAVALIGFQKWSASRREGAFSLQTCLSSCPVCPRRSVRERALSRELNEIGV